jgi:Zn finger protein HypA/HybF involved in hydrogenase expression
MSINCVDCGASVSIPDDVISGEIIGCPDCGLDYVVVDDGSGSLSIQELMIEGEDWGE